MTCPDRDELIHLREHALPEHRAGELRAHAASCAACRDRLAQLARLVADLRAPIEWPAAPGPREVARVMRRIDASVPAPRRVWPRFAVAAAAIAAAITALAVWPARDPGGFTARGGGAPLTADHVTAEAIDREVGTALYALGAHPEPLAAGARVLPSTAFVLGYRNLAHGVPRFVLAFAVDAAHEVHWLYPGFTAAGGDPAALPLPASGATRLMADSVVLEGVAAGALHVIVVVSAEPLRVSAIERLRGDELAATALQRRFASAAVTELVLEVTP
jgi:predicted anti-sigma-YlaC factor YlaD